EQLQLHALRQELADAAQQARVVRVPPEAARDSEDAHDAYACLTSSRETSSLTSLSTAKPPFGSGAFHSSPNSRRSTTVSSSTPTLSLPPRSTCGPVTLPRAVTRWVWSLMVRSPSTSSSPSSRTLIAVEAKRISG